jgi:glycerol-3-phosphate dehydrogenase
MAGLEPIMLEAASDILDGASKGNSALLHTGFDAPEDSVEVRCIQFRYTRNTWRRSKTSSTCRSSKAARWWWAWDEEQLAKLPSDRREGASERRRPMSCRSTAPALREGASRR